MLIPAVMAIVVAGAVVPATTQVQTLSATVDSTTQTLVGTIPDPLTAITGLTLTGVVADASCFMTRGKNGIGPGGHEKCAMLCAQRGNRLALVTSTGDVYMFVGTLAQNNNAGLQQFVNQSVVVTGQVSQVAILAPTVATKTAKTDNRRPAGTEDGIAALVKTGDSRQGDNYTGTETVIDSSSIALAKPISPVS